MAVVRTLVFCLVVSLLGLPHTCEAAVVFLYYNCPNTTTFTANATYQQNLNSLLSSLSSNSTRNSGFYNLTVGQATPDVVYGLFLCRGDVSTQLCQECVTTAAGEIVRRCPREKLSLITYDECMLRYSNRNFFSTVQRDPGLQLLNTQTISEPERFMNLLENTMKNVTARVAIGVSGKKFATAEAFFSSFQTLYTLAQCTPDLSISDCNQCLDGAVSFLPSCCNGKQGGRVIFPSCNVRYELYPFYATASSTPAIPPPLSPGAKGKKKRSWVIIVAIAAPIAAFVVLLAIGVCFIKRRAERKYDALPERSAAGDTSSMQSLQFDLAAIETATNNFSHANKLGEGGFGEVYKGTLPNGQKIAVRKVSQKTSTQGLEKFKNEVILVAKLQHRNLVRMLGFCSEAEESMLIYEFVPNRSLDYFLFDAEKQERLDWARRFNIILGIARGIQYLHEDSRLKIIHRDLNASNILLDEDMNPKISDFGLARIFLADQTGGNTSRVLGTFGYMAPEYAIHGRFSFKSDVYSFGILLLEIISGKKNSNFYEASHDKNLLDYAWKLWCNGTPLELLDTTLGQSYSRNEAARCIHVALLCVQEDPAQRPTMSTIVLMLNSDTVTISSPQRPALIIDSKTESATPTHSL